MLIEQNKNSMLTKQRKPFNTSTKILRLGDSITREHDEMTKSRSSKIMAQEELEKKFAQLYHESEKWQAKKEKMREERKIINEEKQMKDCTFVPQINPEKQEFMTKGSGSFLRRQNDWVLKKEKKIKELQTDSQKKKTKECLFHPKISKKSYSLLFKSEKSEKKQEVKSTQEMNELSTSRSIAGSYRMIHEKKDSYRQLRKTASFKGFTLMTEKRYLERLELQGLQKPPSTQTHSMYDLAREQFSFSSINQSYSPQKLSLQPAYDDYIENIVIGAQEQDTLNSFSSMEIKSDRRQENEEVKNEIFEQAEEESLGHVEGEQGEAHNDEQGGSCQYEEEYSYDEQYDERNKSHLSHSHSSHNQHNEPSVDENNSYHHQKGANLLQSQLSELQLQNENPQDSSLQKANIDL